MSEAAARSWVVFGAGGHARSVIDVIERRGERVAAVVGEPRGGTWRHRLLTDEAEGLDLAVEGGHGAVPAIGASAPRLGVVAALVARGWRGPTLVAATATVAPDVEPGPGTVILEHAHVGPASRVGTAVIVNTGAVVEHDCTVGDGVHLGPGAYLLGAAHVGERSFIGSGARVLPGVRVGADVTVGAGAVVVADVPDGATVVGIPARLVRPPG
jgi:sugar O-acyltransferase (sialic acid O-acetyltransferase NeuD family)